MEFANLHLHTYFSDGCLSPKALTEKIWKQPGLKYFALTDHDTLSGVEPLFRALMRCNGSGNTKRFIPGIELSLQEERTGLAVHIIGLFPDINRKNHREKLRRIDAVLGDFCRYRAEHRALKDIDARIRKAFALNLEGIADRYESPETVIRILRHKAETINRSRFAENDKTRDTIQYPIPPTYQVLIDHWETLIPASSRKKAALYVLRSDPSKRLRMTHIYISEGMAESEARQLAEIRQGCLLLPGVTSPLKELGILDGLSLLREAGAVTILAHPAVDHHLIGYGDFDQHVLYPLMEGGLDGIEVFYPYDESFRDEAIGRYLAVSRKNGRLISGGTDFHGDGRTGLADVKLSSKAMEKILITPCIPQP